MKALVSSADLRKSEHGAALVVTLIVCAVLAVVVTAMMQNTSLDRSSSRGIANQYRAKLAAESGAAMARGMVADLFGRYPDSVTGWQNIGGTGTDLNGTNNEATVLYARAQAGNTNLGASPAASGSGVVFVAQPLVSRTNTASVPQNNLITLNTNPLSLSAVSTNLRFATNDPAMVNINATNSSRPDPFVGLRTSTNGGAPVTAAQWIYVTKYGGVTNATNPYVARYAFWLEDESFKLNINVAGRGARENASLGTNASEIRVDGAFASSSNSTVRNIEASAVLGVRSNLPSSNFPSAATVALAAAVTNAAELRFMTTTDSAGLDLSRGGFRRFPIVPSSFATDDITPLKRFIAAITNTNACPDFGQRFYKTAASAGSATYVDLLNSNQVTTNQSAIGSSQIPFAADLYLLRLAANLRDALDGDSTPTIITGTNVANAQFLSSTARSNYQTPSTAWAISPAGGGTLGRPVIYTTPAGGSGANVAAIGKENVPRLQEYAIHGRVHSMDPVGVNDPRTANPGALFRISIDHYLEFWNMGSEPIDLKGFFVRIYDMPTMNVSGSSSPSLNNPARSVTLLVTDQGAGNLPPSAYVIPAGGLKIITTADPTNFTQLNTNMFPPLTNSSGQPDPDRIYNIFARAVRSGDREFSGTTYTYAGGVRATNASGAVFSNAYRVETAYRNGSVGSSSTDYGTSVVMGNTNSGRGFIDSLIGLPVAWSGFDGAFDLDARHPDRTNPAAAVPSLTNRGQNLYYVRSGSLMGNSAASTTSGFGDPLGSTGDPSTLNEALEVLVYRSSSLATNTEQARFSAETSQTSAAPARMNAAGRLVDGSGAIEPHLSIPNSEYVDPSRWPDCSDFNSAIYYNPGFSGGLRTIGDLGLIADPVRLMGGASTIDRVRGGGRTLRIGQSELYNRTNNRPGLWDGFQTNASRNRTAWRLADIFTTNTNTANVVIKGLVNPNGALRDGGAAMRAALFGMTLMGSPEGSTAVAGPINISNIIFSASTNSPGLICRLTNTNRWIPGAFNPLWERGEISELGGSYAFTNFVGTANPATSVFDRSREEIMRRTMDMITMRGSIFSVYAVGQALQVVGTTTNVLSTVRLKQTFETLPVLPQGANNDSFNPSGEVYTRFAPVTNYTTRVLQTFYD